VKSILKTRFSITAMLLMLLVVAAVIALPTMAYAATFASEFPAPGATVHTASNYVAVDVLGSVTIKSATVNGVAAGVIPGNSTGTWTYTEGAPVEMPVGSGNFVYTAHWAWSAGGSVAIASVAAPFTFAVGTNDVEVVAVDTDGVESTDSWSFDYVENGTIPPVIPPVAFDNLTCTTGSWCHVHDAAGYATDNAMGPDCYSCHNGVNGTVGEPMHTLTPTVDEVTGVSSIGTAHDTLMANLDGGPAAACTACHGDDVNFVASRSGVSPNYVYTVPWVTGGTAEHRACSCHKYNEADPGYVCTDCHDGGHGATHGWDLLGSDAHIASGHNTTAYGTIGAKEMFDGSEGVTLHSINMSGTLTPAADPAEEVLETEWQFPSVNVFWAAGDPDAPAGAMTGLTKDSVITCEDCHTGLEANEAAGPHGGESFTMAGIDPAFPGDFSYGELTKWIVTNPAGMKLRTTLATFTISASTGLISAAGNPALIGTAPYTSGNSLICAKCHDLMNMYSGNTYGSTTKAWWSSTGLTDTVTGKINVAVVGGSNTAHTSHHQDQVDGSPQCVNCHIGLPHGWLRPRLLVNTAKDTAPYLDPDHLGTSRTNNGVTMTNGWNGIGMETLSGEDEHIRASNGWVPWTEAECEACNDHAAEGTIGTNGLSTFLPEGNRRVEE
jgi:hypothetical protein